MSKVGDAYRALGAAWDAEQGGAVSPTPNPVPTPTPAPTSIVMLLPVVLQDFSQETFGKVVNGVTRWQRQGWMKDAGIAFSPAEATIVNGEMDLKLDPVAKLCAEVQYGAYYSAPGGFRYGFEATLDVAQAGVVQSPLFLYGSGGELDFEDAGINGFTCTLHGVGSPGLKTTTIPRPAAGVKHLFEIEIHPGQLAVWFIDGKEVWRVAVTDLTNPTLFPTGPMTAIADVWASSNTPWVGKYANTSALLRLHRWGVSKSA